MGSLTRARAKMLAVAAMLSIPAMIYFASGSASDPLDETLESFGFLPLTPPSNLMDIGSLYLVSADTRHFWPICNADASDVKGMTRHSHSVGLEGVDRSRGSLVASAESGVMKLFGASDAYNRTERFVLTDISMDEISLEDIGAIYQKMMNKPECNRLAMQYIRSSGYYVCQEQKILRAAKFQRAREADSRLSDKGEAEVGNKGLKSESEVGDSLRIDEKSGPDTDSELTYGVAMTPQCMTPDDARFARALPSGRWDQAYNYILFTFIEPALEMLPTRQVEVAAAPNDAPAPR